ncbi:MAG: dATP/dGTP pyrophosphohydrolase domain-containing protein [Pseudomonadota bacterium]
MHNSEKTTTKDEDQASICAWAEEIFGPVREPVALVDRAKLEMDELREAVEVVDQNEIGREAADVLILLYRLADQFGIDLDGAVQAKMAINRARRWQAAGDGTGSHI